MSRCPHGNRNCKPGSPCTPCSGTKGVLRDGEAVVARLALMDSAQRAIAQSVPRTSASGPRDNPQDVRDQARRDHEAWKARGEPIHHDGLSDYEAAVLASNARSNAAALEEARRKGAVMQAARDHYREQHEAHERAIAADPAGAAYHAQYQR